MSRSRARWVFRGEEQAAIRPECVKAADGSHLLARLLVNRGLHSAQAITQFLALEHYTPGDPGDLPDLAPALQRLRHAIDQQEPILIFGDFDVDGQTGTAIWLETLTHLGANVSTYIPDRASEGHGLNATALCRLVSARCLKLVITTDTGITNFTEVSLLRGLGVDTIITDHHDLPDQLPPALANINPKRFSDPTHPMAAMCGAGVAYKVCLALLASYDQAGFADTLLDLVALGTVVDMMPLLQENRWLVWRGLQVMNAARRPGLAALLAQAGAPPDGEMTSETLGFTLGPRLNAVGRMERADEAVELLTSRDPERCRVLAAKFEALNRKRQELCEQTVLDAERHVAAHGGLDGKRVLILANADWHPGIIGLAATRLKEKFNVPVFLLIPDTAKGEIRCSARSIEGFPLMERLSALQAYFLHAGGHAGAGGFALKLERYDAFRRDLEALAARHVDDDMMRPTLTVDNRLDWDHLTPGLVDLINRMRPFGQANPAPLFALENLAITAQKPLGDTGDHLKLILAPAANGSGVRHETREGIIWGFSRQANGTGRLDASVPWSLVVSAEQNHWRGETRLQLIIKDYAKTPTASGGSSVTTAPITRRVETTRPQVDPAPVLPAPQTAAAVLPPPERVMTQPSARSAILPNDDEAGVIWIDHRSRDSVETFVGQLMLPLQDGRSVALYHEGRPPQIPFLQEAIVCSRTTLRAADELIFWDLPPDPATMAQVMTSVQPSLVHLVGGKYQTAPVFPPARDLIRLVAMAIRHMAADTPEGVLVTLSLPELAWRLATTPTVILHAVLVLEALDGITLAPLAGDAPQTIRLHADAALDPATIPETAALSPLLTYHALRQALLQVSRYRDWLLSAPLEAIKTAWPLMPDLFSLAAATEPTLAGARQA